MKKEEKIKILQDVVRIESINNNEEEVALYLQNLLYKHNIESEIIEYSKGRSNLVVEIQNGENGRVLGFTGHMDVVNIGDGKDWLYPPFSGHIEGDKLYGRGSTDMKSGLVASVIALIELQQEKAAFNGKIKLLATVGEEVGELGAEQLTIAGYADDLDALIVGEPSGYRIVYTHKGFINYTVQSFGKSAHSSMPEEGYNAITHLNNFITAINEAMDEVTNTYENEELGCLTHNVTLISGGDQVNSIPAKADLQGSIRTIPEFDNEQVIELLQKTVNTLNVNEPYKLTLHIDISKKSVASNPNSELIQAIQRQFTSPIPVIGLSGSTDAAEFIKGKKAFDIAMFGPGETYLAHQVDEYVSIENYLDIITKYKAIALDYLS